MCIVAYLLTARIVEAEKQPLLVNDPYTQQRNASRTIYHATIEEVMQAAFSVCPRRACYAAVRQTYLCSSESTRNNRRSDVFCGSARRLYNEDLKQLELELSRKLSSARVSEKRWRLQQRIESPELAVSRILWK
jgi:hypothetical protein